MTTNPEKESIWSAYHARRPIRVPVTYGVNPRVVVLDEKWNPAGISFEEYWRNPRAAAQIQLRFMDYQAEYLNNYRDMPLGRPKQYEFYVDNQNVYDAAYFGCPVHFRDGQVADAGMILEGQDKHRIFEMDLDHPLENPFIKEVLARYEGLKAAVAKLPDVGVQFTVRPPLMGFDGTLTIAACLRGTEIFTDLYEDLQYVRRLFDFIHKGVRLRNQALCELFGQPFCKEQCAWFADDSIQLISLEMYKEVVLPYHRQWYEQFSKTGPHSIHLCGNAGRHFPTIRKELNVYTFDTGFPLDHGLIRRQLGPDVEIYGGPEVGLLVGGTAEQVYQRAKEILLSGIKEGGRFVLREGNNLPPRVPDANLAAMYKAALDFGGYS